MAGIVIIILFAVFLFLAAVMIIDSNRFVIREYTIESKKIKDGLDFVVLADLHNKQYGKENSRLLAAIDKLQPHVVLAAGDILTAKPGKSFEKAADFMEKVAAHYPVYYALGNHEYRMKIYQQEYQDAFFTYKKRLEEAGIVVLDNESAMIQIKQNERISNIRVSGLSIERRYYKRFRKINMESAYVEKMIGNASVNAYQILLAHNPEYFKNYADWGADLVLSGHVHGGIMRLPFLGGVISPKLVLFPKYDGGHFQKHFTHMILSRGLGMHTIPIRIFNPAELVVVHLREHKE